MMWGEGDAGSLSLSKAGVGGIVWEKQYGSHVTA